MAKSPDRNKLIDRFLAEPYDTELHEVLPLIPVEAICGAIEKRYGITSDTTFSMSYERLAIVVETSEVLREGGLDPSRYDYDTWFRAGQPSLGGDSPRLLLMRGKTEKLTAFAERTVAQARKLG